MKGRRTANAAVRLAESAAAASARSLTAGTASAIKVSGRAKSSDQPEGDRAPKKTGGGAYEPNDPQDRSGTRKIPKLVGLAGPQAFLLPPFLHETSDETEYA